METNLIKHKLSLQNNIWGNKQFLFLWIGNTISSFTFSIFTLSLPLIIFDLTQSPIAMSSMRAVEFLPNLLLAIFIGVIVDRVSRKKVMVISLILQIFVLFNIVILLGNFKINLLLIYILGFILYTSLYTFGNAFQSTLPSLVKKQHLVEANSIFTAVSSLISIIGPAFAGLIIFVLGNIYSLLITIIGVFFLLITIIFVKIPKVNSQNNSNGFWSDIKEGWSSLVENKKLWGLTKLVLLNNISSSFSFAILVFFALDVTKITEPQLGLVFTFYALGSIISSLLAKKLSQKMSMRRLYLNSFYIKALGCFVLFLSNDWFTLAFGMFLIGFSSSIIGIHYSTLRQVSTPQHLLGRVSGTSSTIMKLAVPLSFLSAGALGEIINVQYVFLISTLICLMLAFSIYRSNIFD